MWHLFTTWMKSFCFGDLVFLFFLYGDLPVLGCSAGCVWAESTWSAGISTQVSVICCLQTVSSGGRTTDTSCVEGTCLICCDKGFAYLFAADAVRRLGERANRLQQCCVCDKVLEDWGESHGRSAACINYPKWNDWSHLRLLTGYNLPARLQTLY